MLSSKLTAALNDQLTFELESGHIYVAMAAWCANNNLPGFRHWFITQEQEERFHGMKFFDFITEMGAAVNIQGFKAPQNEFSSLIEVFSKALEHEKVVTQRIYGLMDIAHEEREYRTISFLNWFVDEQREEEDTFPSLLARIERAERDPGALMQLDDWAATRVFTPPTEESVN